MELTIVDNYVDMVTAWRNLHIPTASSESRPPHCWCKLMLSADDADVEAAPKDKMFSTTVSIRGLLKFLNSHLVGGTAIACEVSGPHVVHQLMVSGICEKHCIIAYVYIGELRA